MAVVFKEWLFNKFPHRYKREDSYKDVNGKGLFERFLNALGDELDNEVIPYIENALNNLDPILVPDTLLPHLADTLGNPPDTFKDEDKYRLLLKYLIRINQLKGTVAAYDLLFSIFGVTVTITESTIERYLYDSGLFYDDDVNPFIHDGDCPVCVCYGIAIDDPDDHYPKFGSLTSSELQNLLKLITYIQPIDLTLCTLSYNGTPISLGD